MITLYAERNDGLKAYLTNYGVSVIVKEVQDWFKAYFPDKNEIIDQQHPFECVDVYKNNFKLFKDMENLDDYANTLTHYLRVYDSETITIGDLKQRDIRNVVPCAQFSAVSDAECAKIICPQDEVNSLKELEHRYYFNGLVDSSMFALGLTVLEPYETPEYIFESETNIYVVSKHDCRSSGWGSSYDTYVCEPITDVFCGLKDFLSRQDVSVIETNFHTQSVVFEYCGVKFTISRYDFAWFTISLEIDGVTFKQAIHYSITSDDIANAIDLILNKEGTYIR